MEQFVRETLNFVELNGKEIGVFLIFFLPQFVPILPALLVARWRRHSLLLPIGMMITAFPLNWLITIFVFSRAGIGNLFYATLTTMIVNILSFYVRTFGMRRGEVPSAKSSVFILLASMLGVFVLNCFIPSYEAK